MLKKFCIGVCCIMVAFLFTACGTSSVTQNDFVIEISADKTTITAGETIKITVTLKNTSGKNVRIQMPTPLREELQDVIEIGFYPETSEHSFTLESLGGRKLEKTIEKDAIITRTIEFSIEELMNHEAKGAAFFYVGKGYKELIALESEPIKILLGGN